MLGRRCSFHSGRHGPRFFSDFCLNLKKIFTWFFSFFFFYDPPPLYCPLVLKVLDSYPAMTVAPCDRKNKQTENQKWYVSLGACRCFERRIVSHNPPPPCPVGPASAGTRVTVGAAWLSGCSVRNCHFFSFFFNERSGASCYKLQKALLQSPVYCFVFDFFFFEK